MKAPSFGYTIPLLRKINLCYNRICLIWISNEQSGVSQRCSSITALSRRVPTNDYTPQFCCQLQYNRLIVKPNWVGQSKNTRICITYVTTYIHTYVCAKKTKGVTLFGTKQCSEETNQTYIPIPNLIVQCTLPSIFYSTVHVFVYKLNVVHVIYFNKLRPLIKVFCKMCSI